MMNSKFMGILILVLGLVSSLPLHALEQNHVEQLIQKHQNNHSHFERVLKQFSAGEAVDDSNSYFPTPRLDVSESGELKIGGTSIGLSGKNLESQMGALKGFPKKVRAGEELLNRSLIPGRLHKSHQLWRRA